MMAFFKNVLVMLAGGYLAAMLAWPVAYTIMPWLKLNETELAEWKQEHERTLQRAQEEAQQVQEKTPNQSSAAQKSGSTQTAQVRAPEPRPAPPPPPPAPSDPVPADLRARIEAVLSEMNREGFVRTTGCTYPATDYSRSDLADRGVENLGEVWNHAWNSGIRMRDCLRGNVDRIKRIAFNHQSRLQSMTPELPVNHALARQADATIKNYNARLNEAIERERVVSNEMVKRIENLKNKLLAEIRNREQKMEAQERERTMACMSDCGMRAAENGPTGFGIYYGNPSYRPPFDMQACYADCRSNGTRQERMASLPRIDYSTLRDNEDTRIEIRVWGDRSKVVVY